MVISSNNKNHNISDGDRFFLRKRLRKLSDSSGKMTDSSLCIEKWTLSLSLPDDHL